LLKKNVFKKVSKLIQPEIGLELEQHLDLRQIELTCFFKKRLISEIGAPVSSLRIDVPAGSSVGLNPSNLTLYRGNVFYKKYSLPCRALLQQAKVALGP
jgi:hypothetical protein